MEYKRGERARARRGGKHNPNFEDQLHFFVVPNR